MNGQTFHYNPRKRRKSHHHHHHQHHKLYASLAPPLLVNVATWNGSIATSVCSDIENEDLTIHSPPVLLQGPRGFNKHAKWRLSKNNSMSKSWRDVPMTGAREIRINTFTLPYGVLVSACFQSCCYRVPVGSPSRGGDVAVDVFLTETNRACPLIFILFLCLFLSLWPL